MALRGFAEISLSAIRAELPASVEKSDARRSSTNVACNSRRERLGSLLQTIAKFRSEVGETNIALHILSLVVSRRVRNGAAVRFQPA